MDAFKSWNKEAEEMKKAAQEDAHTVDSATKNCQISKNAGGAIAEISMALAPFTFGLSMIGAGIGGLVAGGATLAEHGVPAGRVEERIKPLAGSFIEATKKLIESYPAVREPGARLIFLVGELNGQTAWAKSGDTMVDYLRGVIKAIEDIRRLIHSS